METLGQGQDDSQEWLLLGAAEKQEVWEESPSSLACSGFSSWVLSCLERILGNAKDILPSAWEWSQRPRMEEHKMGILTRLGRQGEAHPDCGPHPWGLLFMTEQSTSASPVPLGGAHLRPSLGDLLDSSWTFQPMACSNGGNSLLF
ncbi:uncharacterized protein ACBT57_021030 isoform 3-T3 [Dama dama]